MTSTLHRYPRVDNLKVQPPKWFWMKISDLIDFGSLGDRKYDDDTESDNLSWLEENKATAEHFHELLDSIATRGFFWPIGVKRVYREEYGVTNGHHRLIAAIELGYQYIPATTDINLDGYDGQYNWRNK